LAAPDAAPGAADAVSSQIRDEDFFGGSHAFYDGVGCNDIRRRASNTTENAAIPVVAS